MAIGFDPQRKSSGEREEIARLHSNEITNFDHGSRASEHEKHAKELRALAKAHRGSGMAHSANLISRAARGHDELASLHNEIAEHLEPVDTNPQEGPA